MIQGYCLIKLFSLCRLLAPVLGVLADVEKKQINNGSIVRLSRKTVILNVQHR